MGIITEFIAIVSGVLVGEWIARRIDRKYQERFIL